MQADRDAQIQQLESKIQDLTSELADRDAEFAAVQADRAELADAKSTILKQNDKIRELERGFSLQQTSAPAIELPEPADLLNQLKGKRKKSKAELADMATILEILEAQE